VQLSASASEEQARQRRDALAREIDDPLRVIFLDGLYRVLVGEFSTEQDAQQRQRRAVAHGLFDALVVPVPAAR
jgi:hypothetical protein